VKKQKRQYAIDNAEFIRSQRFLTKYGITLADRDAMIAMQGGCAICLNMVPDTDWHVDHDHETGAVRGVLCRWCNLTLGNAKENVNRLRRAADYLDRFT
jgi:hypothetical protein